MKTTESPKIISLVGRRPRADTPTKEYTKKEALKIISKLAWDDIDAYLSLEKSCLSTKPVLMESAIKEKLKKLQLINSEGYPSSSVRSVIRSILSNYSKGMMLSS